MKEAVIIGAGQTGRGFIAPIMQANAYHITFIDKNEQLIDKLKNEGSYTVQYFGDAKPPVEVSGYDAYTTAEEEIVNILANADLITTSVFAGNIKELAASGRKNTCQYCGGSDFLYDLAAGCRRSAVDQ